jgi:hypothetical protein
MDNSSRSSQQEELDGEKANHLTPNCSSLVLLLRWGPVLHMTATSFYIYIYIYKLISSLFLYLKIFYFLKNILYFNIKNKKILF